MTQARVGVSISVLALVLCACTQTSPEEPPMGPVDYGILMAVRDFTINFPAEPGTTAEADRRLEFSFLSAYPRGDFSEFERTDLPAWQRSIRVVTWPERELVPGHWEVSTGPVRISFVQDEPFAARWYALQINLSTLPAPLGIWNDEAPERGLAAHSLIDGWVTSRFHTGSPALILVGGVWDSGSGTIGLGSTVPVFTSTGLAAREILAVSAGGRPVRCEPPVTDFRPGDPVTGSWSCFGDLGPSENIEVSLLTDVLVTADGARARVCATGSPPRWVSRPGAPGDFQAILPGTDCPDSAFLPLEGL